MTDFFNAVSNFGFPVVVAGYLLFRVEGKMDSFGKRIDRFSDVIEGRPSEGKEGLIHVMQKNNEETKNLANQVKGLSKKMPKLRS